MSAKDPEKFVMQDPDAQLEKHYIEEYLAARGYTWESAHKLPEEEFKRLMTEASKYTSVKLAQVEDKAELARKIHGTSRPI